MHRCIRPAARGASLLALGTIAATGLAAVGDLKWSVPLGPGYNYDASVSLGPNRAIHAVVHTDTFEGRLYSISPAGRTNWIVSLPDAFGTPTVLGDGMIVVPGEQNLYALSADGAPVWQLGFWERIASPVMAVGPDGSLYLLTGDGELWSVSRTGTVNWHQPTSGDSAGPRVGADGTLYLPANGSAPYAAGVAALDPATGYPREIQHGWPGSAGVGATDGLLFSGDRLGLPAGHTGFLLTSQLDYRLTFTVKVGGVEVPLASQWMAADASDAIFVAVTNGLVKVRLPARAGAEPTLVWQANLPAGLTEPGRFALANDGGLFLLTLNGAGNVVAARLDRNGVLAATPRAVTPALQPPTAYGAPVIGADGTMYGLASGLVAPALDQRSFLFAVEGPTNTTRRTWSQSAADLRRTGRLASPGADVAIDWTRRLPDGRIEIVVQGEPDRACAVEVSADLKSWSSLGNRSSANGCLRVVDAPPAGTAVRFYRVVPPR